MRDGQIIFDKKSFRDYTPEGRLVVRDNLIAKEQVSEYLGKWLGDGFDPAAVYRVYRPLSVLTAAIPSIERIPLLAAHRDDTPETPSGLRCGAVSNVRPNADGLLADVTLWDAEEIGRVEDGIDIEVSLGYDAKFVMEAGEWNGQPYDARFTEITANHLAMVREGRSGHDVRINDAADVLPNQEDDVMGNEQLEELQKRLAHMESLLAAKFADAKDEEEEEEKPIKAEDEDDKDDEDASVMDADEKEDDGEKESKRIADAADMIRKEMKAHAAALSEVSEVLGTTINDSVDTSKLYIDALAAMGVKGVSKAAAREVFRAVKAERASATATRAERSAPVVFDAAEVQADPLLAKLVRAGNNYLKG